MQLQSQNGQLISLGKELGSGGEGKIYAVRRQPNLAAKIYHPQKLNSETGMKLQIMYHNPPEDPMAAQGHPSIAWPVDLLRLPQKVNVVGFLMPLVTKGVPIFDFYNPRTRRQKCPLFNYAYLHRTARNLAVAFDALHNRGYVIGDVNESNILVTDSALVTLVDTDSFQVKDDQSQRVYRCPVGKPEFTPPELQGETFRDIDRQQEHDLFGLGVLIFQLLMEGIHPFAGKYTRRGEPPLLGERIKAGHFPYSRKSVPFQPMPFAPPWHLLAGDLQDLFLQCFETGHKKPQARPNARLWIDALRTAEASLRTCKVNSQHRYHRNLSSCPWCERRRKLAGRDPFPSLKEIRTGQHLKPVKRRKPKPQTPYAPRQGQAQSAMPFPYLAIPHSDPNLVGNLSNVSVKVRSLLREILFATATIGVVSFILLQGYSLYNRPKPFVEAVRIAEKAVGEGQEVDTVEEWVGIAAQWRRASELMAEVSPEYSKYSIAQDKVQEYFEYSEIALQEARFIKLREKLGAGLWKEADQMTWEIVIKAVGNDVRDHLKREEIETFPCHDLEAIDKLWTQYSDGRFGFSVQNKIWQEAGGLDGKFGELVGWRPPSILTTTFPFNGDWLYYKQLKFSLSAPPGHLPADVTMCGGGGLSRPGCGGKATWTWRQKFLERVASCEL